MPRLIICQDAQDYRVIEFTTTVTIGRDDDNDIVLASPQVSRRHASINRQENGSFVLFDHESTNAVWMEHKQINAVPLAHGMTFRIVDYFFTFINEVDDRRPSRVFAHPNAPTTPLPSPIDSATILFSLEPTPMEPPFLPVALSSSDEGTKMASLADFLRELHQIDEEQVLGERLLTDATALLQAERGFLALLNPKNELIYAATHHFDPQKESREVRQDIVQRVMDQGCTGTAGGEAAGEKSRRDKDGRERSVLCAPLLREGKAMGCLYLDHRDQHFFKASAQAALIILALHGAVLLDNLIGRKRMHQEREALKTRLASKDETIIRSEKMVKLYEDIRTIAPINVPVFISGEAGSGKEHVAAALHNFSQRKGAYIPLNCAAIPEGLFESELFGSRKGAFHEAIDKSGKLELAEGGTLFLDEVADMSLTLQPKLLRFLENGEISRLGDTRVKKLDVRVVTATNRDVADMIRAQTFRDDLFQRLSCFTLKVPPLRERVEDIEPLARYFLGKFSAEYHWKEPRIADNGMQLLLQYQWPGNIRQLRNVLLRLAVQSQGRLITEREILALSEEFGVMKPAGIEVFPSLEEMEKNHIKAALDRADGNISDAAGLVGIARSTLYQKMKKYNISA
ncbi:MAG: sigma 54-interacting transcriptional regulator [Desulfobulbaceae bacterium]|jgi:DNA-binding NtrC family response regulator/pSer/pThr/pTyr-binding forkhead associated (FHA) protein|nr:sigma 54-interacting transcriptional regulator [Desulfobulbaceae bacterium]